MSLVTDQCPVMVRRTETENQTHTHKAQDVRERYSTDADEMLLDKSLKEVSCQLTPGEWEQENCARQRGGVGGENEKDTHIQI